MKKKLVLLTLSAIIFTTAFAKVLTTTFKVEGQCGECKERIEAALDAEGVIFAEWDVDSKLLTVKYNNKKISLDDVHAKISAAGYSTSKVKANPTAEKLLPGCCQPGGH
ncbi:MAG: mercuric ion binding protein [Bacteroidia bacterium]|jgi:mercuric ion binding protein